MQRAANEVLAVHATRLRRVSQLGFVQCWAPPGVTRFEHSRRVAGNMQVVLKALMSQEEAQKRGLTEGVARALVKAAAVHDFGHGAFSHDLDEMLTAWRAPKAMCMHEWRTLALLVGSPLRARFSRWERVVAVHAVFPKCEKHWRGLPDHERVELARAWPELEELVGTPCPAPQWCRELVAGPCCDVDRLTHIGHDATTLGVDVLERVLERWMRGARFTEDGVAFANEEFVVRARELLRTEFYRSETAMGFKEAATRALRERDEYAEWRASVLLAIHTWPSHQWTSVREVAFPIDLMRSWDARICRQLDRARRKLWEHSETLG